MLINVERVTKVYEDNVVALEDVTVEFRPGQINCLLGENGAGKSTLAKIIAGVLKPTSGAIKVDGVEARFRGPRDAMRTGIGVVYQYPSLFEDLTVIENVVAFNRLHGRSRSSARRLADEAERFTEFAEKMGFNIDVYKKVYSLPANVKQIVEILRLLYAQMNTLILDEATSMLTPLETERIYETVCRLRDEGRNVIWITHRPHEVRQICSRVIVLRKGRVVYTTEKPLATADEMNEIINYMFGVNEAGQSKLGVWWSSERELKADRAVERAEALVVKDLYVEGDYGDLKVKHLDLAIRRGEIMGLTGIAGHGQRELVEAIVGLRKVKSGKIYLMGKDVTSSSVRERLKAGLVYIPAERLKKAVASDLSIIVDLAAYWLNASTNQNIFAENVVGMTFVNYNRLKAHAINVLKRFRVSCPDIAAPVKSLSGGNIQKLILAKMLERENISLVIAEEPTAGLDFITAAETRSALRELKSRGVSILLVSSDIYELIELSDRLAVMYDGRIVKVFNDTTSIDMLELSRYMLGLGV